MTLRSFATPNVPLIGAFVQYRMRGFPAVLRIRAAGLRWSLKAIRKQPIFGTQRDQEFGLPLGLPHGKPVNAPIAAPSEPGERARMTDPHPASATLLAVLAEIFARSRKGGGSFDHRSIALEVRNHPKLLAAMEFLGVERATTGWRAGSLSNDGKQRIKQWLDSIEGEALDGWRLERVPLGRYRVARAPRVLSLADLTARPSVADEDVPASEALLAVLADVFWPGRQGGGQFDHRSIATEAAKHPRLFGALGFLKVEKSTTGWRTGALSNDSIDRIKDWLAAVEGRELGGRRLERTALGHYRVALLRHDELPLFC